MQETLTISKYYEEDHYRLDGLFKSFQERKRTDFSRAREYFDQFKFGLRRHSAWEEEILFPFFEKKIGEAFSQPVYVMRLEHRQIGKFLELIHNRLWEGDPNTDKEERELLVFLEKHNIKEEQILYPAIDNAATQEDLESIFMTMNSLPVEKYEVYATEFVQNRKD
ncbi:hemerythrin domain-containing protein [bacterium]|nr:hemerythrin domain-containing protein [bacterium]